MSLSTLLLSALAATTAASPFPHRRQSTSTSYVFALSATVTSDFDLTPSLNGAELQGNDTVLYTGFGATGHGSVVFGAAGEGHGFYTRTETAGIAWFAESTATAQAPMTVASGQLVNVTAGGTGTEGITVSPGADNATYYLTNAAGGVWLGCPATLFGFEGGQGDYVVLSWRADNETTMAGCAEVVLTPICNVIGAAPTNSEDVVCTVRQ